MDEPSTVDPPDPALATCPAEFVERLRALRLWAGAPSLRRLRQLAGTTLDAQGVEIDALPVSTVSHVLRGDRMPRMDFVRAFVTACLRARRQDPTTIAGTVERWHDGWLRLQQGGVPAEPASPDTPSAPRQLPLAATGFSGRADELALLGKALAITDRPSPWVISAIDGPGGVGKSTLAIHAAHRAAQDFPDGQLYVDLQGATAGLTPLPPLEVLGRFLRALGVAGGEIPEHVDEAAARFRTAVADRRLLLVLDNAAGAGQVRPLLPGTPSCRVLVTSRQPLSGLDGTRLVHLDVLPEPEAVSVLARAIGAERVAAEPAAATEVVRRCGGLPLALRIAATRLAARPAWPVAALARRLADEQRRLDELRVADTGVRASFDVSYHQLRDGDDPTDREAACAFGLLGIWDGPDLALPVAARLLDRPDAEAEPLLERLVDTRLLESRSPGRYRLHDLLRLYARELAARSCPGEARTASLERAVRFYTATAWHTLAVLRPGNWRLERQDRRWTGGGRRFADRAEAVAWLEAERPNLLAAAAQAEASDELRPATVQLSQALFAYFFVYRYWQDWNQLNRTALRVARAADDLPAEAGVHHDLGAACYHRGRYDEASEHFGRSLAISRRIGDRQEQARSLSNLSGSYTNLGRHDEALAFLREALALNREHGDRDGEATTLNNLGLVYKGLGRVDDAAAHYEHSLAISRELGDRYFQALTLNNLGAVYILQERYRDALDCLHESLELYRATGNQAGTAMSLDTLGTVHYTQGRYDEALGCFRQSLAICRKLGLRHNEAEVLRNTGAALHALGHTEQARARWREALAICEELHAPVDELRALLSG